jgi:uncharacterized protein YndB with AHSA1/START domain
MCIVGAVHVARVTQDYAASPARVFAALSEHERLNEVFPAQVARIRDGDDDRNGVGSSRWIAIAGPLGFVETITAYEPPHRIVYRVTKGSPLRSQEGTLTFAPTAGGGTRLTYEVSMESSIPGFTVLLKAVLERTLTAGLRKLRP